jgi:hypothetical protein
MHDAALFVLKRFGELVDLDHSLHQPSTSFSRGSLCSAINQVVYNSRII